MNRASKLALVTGASGGIGSQVVAKLHEQGYDLWLVDKNKESLEALGEQTQNSQIQQVDLSVGHEVYELCEQIQTHPQAIDVAVVNAGIVIPKSVVDTSIEEINAQLDINLKSAIFLIQALSKKMLKQDHGNIVVTVSMGAIIALENSALYSASKFGLRGFILALQQELKGSGVKISAVYASGIDTLMLEYEAQNGGNALNFLSTPLAASKVADAMLKALKTGKASVYIPYFDSLTTRLLGAFPWLIYPISPLLKYFGEQGRKKYLKTIQARKQQ